MSAIEEAAALRRCLRAATDKQPLIRNALIKAAHGPERAKHFQLANALRHTEELLDTLKTEQLALGWRGDNERASA
jgi:hypothetical protein